jgi:hypothetical protein
VERRDTVGGLRHNRGQIYEGRWQRWGVRRQGSNRAAVGIEFVGGGEGATTRVGVIGGEGRGRCCGLVVGGGRGWMMLPDDVAA